jgi:hypothetical protein
MCSRTGAEYERLITSRHRRVPFKLFLTPQQPVVRREIMALQASSPCLLDPFTREFLQEFDLDSPEAHGTLNLILSMGFVDTAKVECFHAWVRRVATKLGSQAKRPDLLDVAARSVAQRTKRQSKTFSTWGAGSTFPEPRERPRDASGAAGSGDAGPAPKHRRGGGGEWRSFVSRQFRAGLTDQTMNAQLYAERTPEERLADQERGALGTAMHRMGLDSFGPTKRQAKAAAIKNLALGFNRQHSIGNASFVQPSSSALTLALHDFSDQGLADMLRVVKKADKLQGNDSKVQDHNLDLQVVSYARGEGAVQVRKLLAEFPSLVPFGNCLMHVPRAEGPLAISHFMHCSRAFHTSKLALAFNAKPSIKFGGGGLCASLDSYWAARHRPVYSDDWEGPKPPSSKETTPCCEAGHCICSTSGRRLLRFRNSFLSAMKRVCRRGTAEDTMLREGFVVFLLRGVPRRPIFATLGGPEDSGSEEICEVVYRFWHVALQMFRPYCPVFQEMFCPALDETGTVPLGEELLVEALPMNRSMLCFTPLGPEVVPNMGENCQWHVSDVLSL